MEKTVKTTERGWAAHFIMANRCLFHRNTLVEYKDVKVVVSTVGLCIEKFEPNKQHTFTTVGCDRYYETKVFIADDTEFHDADASQQLDSDCPNEPILWDEINANNIHDRMVEKWKNEIKKVRLEITKTYKHEEQIHFRRVCGTFDGRV